ncbi:TIGR01777 family oxidoreductase [Diaphorobacter caeni]|uniref:TIGR01777 family oxidoreductase n=1 Tax=Diaphorobacter caeni TaxID=2784387 RepID=UPI00188FE882|nr:TIGR01777 family oxidoreductase [Diaphorobacter caeni]MBF5005942.1 TIGR01777 family protein [Diaphorobacter caeni]
MTTMTTLIFCVLGFQTMLGGFDNLWHHELHARLPQRTSARYELRLHAMREAIYGALYVVFAWIQIQGWWAIAVGALLLVEMVVTVADFLEEDRCRKLPPFERALHTVLTVSYGLLLGLLGPRLWDAARLPTELAFTYHGFWSWFCTLAALGVTTWSIRNAIAVRKMGHIADADAQAAPPAPQAIGAPTVLVTGGTGFVGSALVRQLQREGRRVIVLSRDPLLARASFGDDVWVIDRLSDIPAETRIDAIVHLAGANILGGLWTPSRRRKLLQSRLQITRDLLALIERLERRPEVLVAASAVGFYGTAHGNARIDESAASDPGRFQSDLCVAIEREALLAERLGTRVVCVRPGIVLGAGGGALPPQALATRLGLGAIIGSGRQSMPWVHVDDLVGLIRHAMSEPVLHGALNAVAPDMVSQDQFARTLATVHRRPLWMKMPAGALRTMLGEMSELLLDGQNVAPTKALASGYCFRHPALRGALEASV